MRACEGVSRAEHEAQSANQQIRVCCRNLKISRTSPRPAYRPNVIGQFRQFGETVTSRVRQFDRGSPSLLGTQMFFSLPCCVTGHFSAKSAHTSPQGVATLHKPLTPRKAAESQHASPLCFHKHTHPTHHRTPCRPPDLESSRASQRRSMLRSSTSKATTTTRTVSYLLRRW